MSTSTISLRLPDDLANELENVAHETERSKSFHIQKAIELYLQDRVDFQIALDRLNDSTDPIITSKEMRKKFDL
jgi:RHH-type transcriptional regulator, rel operon repressor / antitoxin RelB